MARKAAKSPRKARDPEAEVQDNEAQGAREGAEPTEAGASISKTEAVRRALAAGMEMPEEGVAFIKSEFGIDMEKPHFSAVKSQQRKKQGARGGAGGRSRGRSGRSVEGYLAPPPEGAGGDVDVLQALETMKPLVASLGADRVKRIVDLLG